MGKRWRKFCLLLLMFCLTFAFMGEVAFAAEDGTEEETDRGLAYIADVSCVRSEDYGGMREKYSLKEILPEYKDLEEYIKFYVENIYNGYDRGAYRYYYGNHSTGYSDVTCVIVCAKRGATVSYLKGSKMKVADAADGGYGDYDVYYFHVPYKTVRNGGTFKVTAELKGEKKELQVVFAKPEKKSVTWKPKKLKASIVVSEDSDTECSYGEISLSIDNKEVGRIPIEYEDVRDGASVWVGTGESQIGTYSSIRKEPTHDPEAGKEIWTEKEYEQPVWLGMCDTEGKEKNFYVALDGTPTDTEWKIKSLIWEVNIKSEQRVKVKIPAQKAAPKVKVDMLNGKIGISANMQYCIKLPVIDEDYGLIYEYTGWKDGKKGMKLSDLEKSNIASGAEIYVRIKGGKGKIPSAERYIEIPSRQAIDLTKVSAEGAVTQCAVKISDLDTKKNPYEYTCAEPTASTKWKTLKSASVNLKKNEVNETTPVIYVRQKALNENKKNNIEMRQASTIAVLTYDSTDKKWTASAWDMSKLK